MSSLRTLELFALLCFIALALSLTLFTLSKHSSNPDSFTPTANPSLNRLPGLTTPHSF